MKRKYRTRQIDALLKFLENNADSQLSVNEIAAAVGRTAGKSTVYRRIKELTDTGLVRRFRGEDGRSVFYQFVGEKCIRDNHFHLKCTHCGKLVHLDCTRMEKLAGHIGERHGFLLDSAKCVLYGKCGSCIGEK